MNVKQWELREAIMEMINDHGASMTTAEVCEILEHLRQGLESRSRLVRMKDFKTLAREMEREHLNCTE